MTVEKEYQARVQLPTELDWEFLREIETILRNHGLTTSELTFQNDDGFTKTAKIEDLVNEFPDPLKHESFSLVMSHNGRLRGEIFSERRYGLCSASISGSDQTQVLGLAEVLRRFVDKWEPKDDLTPSAEQIHQPHTLSEMASVREVSQEVSDIPDPLWKQEWFWGAASVVVAIIIGVLTLL